MKHAFALAGVTALVFALAGPAVAQCRLALALGLDVSGSVDRREYRLQLGGLAAALRQPTVQDAFFAVPSAQVYLTVYEWSGPAYQRLLLDWTQISDAQILTRIAGDLSGRARSPAPPGTALGDAMLFGASLLKDGPDCWQRTLDISGDGKSNFGPHPRDAKAAISRQSMTLNALVIGADAPAIGDTRQVEISELTAYFSAWVVVGSGAFVEAALGYDDYESAITRKLLRELEGLSVSLLSGERQSD